MLRKNAETPRFLKVATALYVGHCRCEVDAVLSGMEMVKATLA